MRHSEAGQDSSPTGSSCAAADGRGGLLGGGGGEEEGERERGKPNNPERKMEKELRFEFYAASKSSEVRGSAGRRRCEGESGSGEVALRESKVAVCVTDGGRRSQYLGGHRADVALREAPPVILLRHGQPSRR